MGKGSIKLEIVRIAENKMLPFKIVFKKGNAI
jgi:hypothetical protein